MFTQHSTLDPGGLDSGNPSNTCILSLVAHSCKEMGYHSTCWLGGSSLNQGEPFGREGRNGGCESKVIRQEHLAAAVGRSIVGVERALPVSSQMICCKFPRMESICTEDAPYSILNIFNVLYCSRGGMFCISRSQSLYVFPQYPVRPVGGEWARTAWAEQWESL